ncbi:putative sodium-coupled neutral amino acid transporter 10 isoform X2 [Nematostella vectensis]|uniref:putative sodium-coupled neutral amino acid transporter 10 isoform X2 n=1 Tax=Nematostella vectensis TaxID=45351 RepID=UPI0020771EAA|nr:putative sodium-coupled neutral amino acid transporter 10 isoform X2 [Nematostella vectensis]
MAVHWPIVFNLVNSIVGVSVLAIPFCFHECGVLLGALVMLSSAWITKKSCLLLLTAAQMARRRSYESLAHHSYGALGKLAVEASIIGLCFGTLCAFHVIIGDLAPLVFSNLFGLQAGNSSRTIVMMVLSIGIGLPLALMRNISSLAAVSAMSLIFYAGFVTQTIFSAIPHLMEGHWKDHINFWRPVGVLRCLPIFSLSFSCQTQLFVLYDSLPEPSVKKMEEVINTGINIASFVYLSVGSMCYVTFYDTGVTGDVLINYGNSFLAQVLKTGFVMSVIVSIPLIAFPMRASINSLLFPSQTAGTENMPGGPGYMPQNRFVIITVSAVCITLLIGILIPEIEFVLGVTGATMGTLIAFIIPSLMFLVAVNDTQNSLRSVARVILCIGLVCFIGSTISVLTAPSSHHDTDFVKATPSGPAPTNPVLIVRDGSINVSHGGSIEKAKEDVDKLNVNLKPAVVDSVEKDVKVDHLDKEHVVDAGGDKRVEPANPHPPEEKAVKGSEKILGDSLNRQLMSTDDQNVVKKKEQSSKPLAQEKKDEKVTKMEVDLDPKVEVSKEEIDAEILKLKDKKAEVDADIKNLEEIKAKARHEITLTPRRRRI